MMQWRLSDLTVIIHAIEKQIMLSGKEMPFYEYQCKQCGFEIEVLQKISDAPLKKCDQCGKSTMKKLVSAAAFRLKGGGWYETDFKSGDKKNVADTPAAKKAPEKSGATNKKTATSGGSTTTTKKAANTKK